MAAAARTNGIVPPPKFLPAAGLPQILWNEWRQLFETYCDAIDFNDFADKKQKAILLNCLGTEGQKQFFQIARCYISARCFRAHKSPTQARERKDAQLQGESITENIVALRDLATTCHFGDFLDNALCDQLIEKLHNSNILLAKEKLDLTKAISTTVRLESAIKDAKSMRKSMSANGTEHSSVNAVKKKSSKPYYKRPTGDKYETHVADVVHRNTRRISKVVLR